jgi:hypothetical protein
VTWEPKASSQTLEKEAKSPRWKYRNSAAKLD